MRLARAICSDVSLYNEEKIVRGIEQDRFFDALEDELEEGRELYRSRVSPDLYSRTNFYDRAIVDVILRSKGHVKSQDLVARETLAIDRRDPRRLRRSSPARGSTSRSRGSRPTSPARACSGSSTAGHVRVDGRAAKASARLRGGEPIEVELPPPEPSGLVAQDLPLAVLHEDRDLLVLDKAAGMVVHPARGAPHSTVVNALLHRLGGPEARVGARSTAPARPRPPARQGHLRLPRRREDRGRARGAAGAVQGADGREDLPRALPRALAPEGRLDTPYGRHPRDRTRFTGAREERAPRGHRVARRASAFGGGATLAEVTLHTGRTHQIRVHLAEAGHPLLADAVYGGTRREARLPPDDPVRRAAEAIGRQALHAARLAFDHPRTGRRADVRGAAPGGSPAARSTVLRARGPRRADAAPLERRRMPRGSRAARARRTASAALARVRVEPPREDAARLAGARSGSASMARCCTGQRRGARPRSDSTAASPARSGGLHGASADGLARDRQRLAGAALREQLGGEVVQRGGVLGRELGGAAVGRPPLRGAAAVRERAGRGRSRRAGRAGWAATAARASRRGPRPRARRGTGARWGGRRPPRAPRRPRPAAPPTGFCGPVAPEREPDRVDLRGGDALLEVADGRRHLDLARRAPRGRAAGVRGERARRAPRARRRARGS